MKMAKRRVLVAGMGNVLRKDDGFGVEVARRLLSEGVPGGVEVMEVGIGGMSLVQKLLEGYDELIIADALRQGGPAGTLYMVEPEVPKVDLDEPDIDLLNYLADEHCVEPSKVLTLAKALGVAPRKVLIVGCEPAGQEELGIGLSEPVRRAVEKAVEMVLDAIAKDSK